MLDPNLQLSKHLSVREFTRSSLAARLGIDNRMDEDYLPHAKHYCEQVFEPVRELWGGIPRTPNGGFRSAELNSAMIKAGYPASKTSQHCSANALDLDIVPGENLYQLFIKILQSPLKYDQLMIEGANAHDPQAGWIHYSFNTYKVRGDVSSGLDPFAAQRMQIKVVDFSKSSKGDYRELSQLEAIAFCRSRC